MVRAAAGAGQDMVHLHHPEEEMGAAACTDALLLAVEAVALSASWADGPGRCAWAGYPERWGRPIAPRSSIIRSFTSLMANGERSMPAAHWRPSLSAATRAVAQPQKGPSTMSPGFELALMM